MSGFSNSLYLIFTASNATWPESNIPIHTFRFSNFTKVSRFMSSLDHQYQSIRPTIFAILQHDGQTAEKFASPIHPSTATAPYTPSNLQWTQIPDFQTRTRTRKPGFTEGTRVWKLSSLCQLPCLSTQLHVRRTKYRSEFNLENKSEI